MLMGPYMEILEALAELDRLTGRAPPDLQRGRLDEIEPDEMEPAAADEMGVQGAGSAVQVAGSAGTGRTHQHSPLWWCECLVLPLIHRAPNVHPALLVHYSYFSGCVCVCVCRLTGLVDCGAK